MRARSYFSDHAPEGVKHKVLHSPFPLLLIKVLQLPLLLGRSNSALILYAFPLSSYYDGMHRKGGEEEGHLAQLQQMSLLRPKSR